MDDAAMRSAQDLLDVADRRIVALLEAGVLEAGGLIGPLREARERLIEGDSVSALATCNDILERARLLAERGGSPPGTSRPPEKVRTDRHARPTSGRLAVPEKHPVDSEIAHAAQAGLEARAPTDPQLEERIIARLDSAMAAQSAVLRNELEQRVAASASQLAAVQEALAALNAAQRSTTAEVEQRATETLIDATAQAVTDLGERFAAAQAGLPALIAEAIGGEVRRAIGDLPLRADLDQMAEGIRKDLDWQIERIAAERGWVTINDVQSALAGHKPGTTGAPSTAVFTRLEAALTEFVQQNQLSQERFLGVIQKRFEQGTRVVAENIMTAALNRMPAANVVRRTTRDVLFPETEALPTDENQAAATAAAAAAAAAATTPGTDADLDVLSQTGQIKVLTGASVGQPGTDVNGSEDFSDSSTTRRLPLSKPDRPAVDTSQPPVEMDTSSVHRATEATDLPVDASADDIIAQIAAELSAGGTSKVANSGVMSSPVEDDNLPSTATATAPPSASTRLASPQALDLDPLIQRLTALETRLAQPQVASTNPDREAVLHQLADHQVRQRILGLVAVEVVANPGALGELTGIRAFIRREIRQAAEEVAATLRREQAPEVASL